MFYYICKQKNMIDRIKELLRNEQLSPSQFADEINLQRSSLSHVLSGRNKPSLDFVMKIKHRYSKVNLEWLIFGKGSMFSNQNNEVIGRVEKPIEEQKITENAQLLNFDSGISNETIEEKTIKTEKSNPESGQFSVKSESSKTSRVIILYENGTFEEYTNQS